MIPRARPICGGNFIRKGLVKTGTITEEGREIIYDIRKDGDVVGELCALDLSRRDRAVAIATTTAVVVEFREVMAALAGNVALLTTFIAELSRVLATSYEQLNRVARDDVAYDKLLHYVIFTDTLTLAVVALTLFVLRRRRAGDGGFSMPGYPLLPGIYIVCLLAVGARVFTLEPWLALTGIVILLSGWPLFRLGHGMFARGA